jgi:hypothetical protein
MKLQAKSVRVSFPGNRLSSLGSRRAKESSDKGAGGGAGIGMGTVLLILLVCYLMGLFR